MSLGEFIAEEVVKGFILFKPEKIRFFGHDNWLVSGSTRAFYNQKIDAPPHTKVCGLNWCSIFGCSKCRPHSKECGFRETL